MSNELHAPIGIDDSEVFKAYSVLKTGGLILVKGDIGYGLLGHSEESIRKMFRLKGRPEWNSAIVIGSIPVFEDLTLPLTPTANRWLANITRQTTVAVVNSLNKSSLFWTGLPVWVRGHCSVEASVATFLNPGTFVEELVTLAAQDHFLIVGSSANLSFQGNNYRFQDVPRQIVEGVDLALDQGVAKHENNDRLATTIVDLTTWTIRRRGFNVELIERSLAMYLGR